MINLKLVGAAAVLSIALLGPAMANTTSVLITPG
jgi:hypothetical protein